MIKWKYKTYTLDKLGLELEELENNLRALITDDNSETLFKVLVSMKATITVLQESFEPDNKKSISNDNDKEAPGIGD